MTLKMGVLPIDHDTICFFGHPVDDRGRFSTKLTQNSKKFMIKYLREDYSILFDDNKLNFFDFEQQISSIKTIKIFIDATTLTFPELLFLLKAVNNNIHVKNIEILYVEPKEYRKAKSEINSTNVFSLSNKFQNFSPIPTFVSAKDMEKIDFAVFLGFEKARFAKLIESDEGSHYQSFYPVIPLPAYKLGWESHTIKMHLEYLTSENGFEAKNLRMVGASNPYHTHTILAEIATITQKKFRIIPIGTKPTTIGCAVFLVNQWASTPDCSIDAIYDFPEIAPDRSMGIGRINLYTLTKV